MIEISVIMPVYNVSTLLYTSIESIQKQTLKNIEIICVDDGSTDDSLEILDELQEKYENIKIIRQENAGPGIARNTGIENSKGEYIAFLDADDIFLDKTALEKMYKTGHENNADMVGANLKFIHKNYTLNKYYDFFNTRFTYYYKNSIMEAEEYGIPFAFYKNIYNRDFINQNNIRFPDKRAGEDPVFMAKVLTNTEKFPVLPIDLYGYNHSMGGGVNEKINTYDKKFSYLEHFKEVFDILKENSFRETFKGYKIEFIDYLIYSNNMYDSDIKRILSILFEDYADYFSEDDYGYFIMDYMLNPDYMEDFRNYDEYALIKKCLLEETFIEDNFIDKNRLNDYLTVTSNNRYDVNKAKLMKGSFSVLNTINENTSLKYESLSEEVEAINNIINEQTYGKNADFLRKYGECRIDVKNHGNPDNKVEIVDCDDSLCDVYEPVWLKDDNGIGSVIYCVNDKLNVSFKCVNDGTLTLSFKGIDYRDKINNRIPVYIDFTRIVVDGETLVRGSRVSWHDNPYDYSKEVKDGQIVEVQLEWLPLNYSSNLRLVPIYDKTIRKLANSRIDIKNDGNSDNRVEIVYCDDNSCSISEPRWLCDDKGIGTVLNSIREHMNFSFKCINDGKLLLSFKGIDYRDKIKDRIPVFIDYTRIVVDGETLVDGSRVSWHDNPYDYTLDVLDGQIVNVQLKWQALKTNSNLELLSLEEKRLNNFSESTIHIKNDIELLENNDSEASVSYTDYVGDNGKRDTLIKSNRGDMKFSFKCLDDEKLHIDFKSCNPEKDNMGVPIFINYQEITVDDEIVLDENRITSFDNPFIFTKEVQNGQTVTVEVKWNSLNKSFTEESLFDNEEIENLKKNGKIKDNEIRELKQQISIAKEENRKLREFKENLLASNSWKITEPLRKIKNIRK